MGDQLEQNQSSFVSSLPGSRTDDQGERSLCSALPRAMLGREKRLRLQRQTPFGLETPCSQNSITEALYNMMT